MEVENYFNQLINSLTTNILFYGLLINSIIEYVTKWDGSIYNSYYISTIVHKIF